MKDIKDILQLALSELKQGSSMGEVLSKWPEHKEELGPLLSVAQTFSQIPKNSVPEPAMRRKFLYEPIKHTVWSSWLHVSRFAAASTAILLLVASAGGTAYGAITSLPGRPLFSLKKTVEQIHISFASNPVDKANLQLALAQKRISEAQQIFNNPNKDPKQELAAINELSNQTKETIASVQTAVTSAPSSQQKDHPLMASLQGLAQQQQQLISKISDNSNAKVATSDSVETKKEVENLARVVAATTDGALITLSPDPNAVTISGTVTALSKDKLTVEKTMFNLDSQTVVKDAEGKVITADKLEKDIKVHIVASKNKTGILATEIMVLSVAGSSQSEVKGTSTTETGINIAKPSSSPTSIKHGPISNASGTDESLIQPVNNTKSIGTYIPEDPKPQFFP